jgi:predicted ATPase
VQSVLSREDIPAAVAQAILTKAEGSPFFLEELAKTVTAQAEGFSSWALPETIQGALMARIDALPDASSRRPLQTIAVIGKACPVSLLRRLMEQPAEELQGFLATLQSREFIYEQPAVPEPLYVLKHALTQDVAYHSMAREQRCELHGCVAQAIEALYQDRLEEHYEDLAHHYQHSGDPGQAIAYLQGAGQRALQQSAHAEAICHLTTALELLTTLPNTQEHAQQELVLQTALGPALIVTKGHAAPEVEHTYARARDLCQQVGETPQLIPVLRGLSIFYMNRAQLQTACTLAEQRLSLAQRQQDQAHLLGAHDSLGGNLFHLGTFAPARTHLEQGLALYHRQWLHAQAVQGGMTDHGVSCLSHAAWVLWFMGYRYQALMRSQEALALTRELGHPFSLVQALYWSAQLHQFLRDAALTQQRAEAAIELSAAHGFAQQQAQGMFLRGWTLAVQRRGEEGLAQMRQGLAAWEATGAKLLRPYYLALLAEVCRQVGQIDTGLCLLEEALVAAHDTSERNYEAELYRLQGELLLALSVANRAEACFHQALDVTRRQRAKSLELRATVSLSRLWQQQGKQDTARQVLVEIYEWFTEGLDTVDLREAKILLDAL